MNENYPSWQRKARRTLVDTPFMRVYEDSVQLPSGAVIDDYTTVTMPSGVIIVATDHEDRLLVQYEYKYAIDKTILNLPSGSLEDGDAILATAARELLEETGYESSDLELIQTLYEYPSKADHLIYVVRAKNARKVTEVAHEETETISPVRLVSPEDMKLMGVFDTTYNVSALALTLPEFLIVDKPATI